MNPLISGLIARERTAELGRKAEAARLTRHRDRR